MNQVLLIDVMCERRQVLASNLRTAHFEVVEAAAWGEGARRLADGRFSLVVVEVAILGSDAVSAVKVIRELDSAISIIVLGDYEMNSVEGDTIRSGICEGLRRPFAPETFLRAADLACRYTQLLRENNRLRSLIEDSGRSSLPDHLPSDLKEDDGLAELQRSTARKDPAENSGPILSPPTSEGSYSKLIPMESLPPRLDLSTFLDDAERDLIVRALDSANGVQAEAARRLGLSRSALAYKLTKYHLRRSEICE